MFLKLQSMTVSEKLELSRKASKEIRALLMRDSNKLVQLAVIESPNITESEVLTIANNRQITDEVLRKIALNRDWMKNYQIKLALTHNPKTPLAIALRQIPYLSQRDLKLISKSRAIARPLAIAAESRLKEVRR
ncbi:MAG TPA: hypothetical protein ENN34_08655 [Deltaproteobacteria bacterium]|nr:hypothetical protein [Deltaproteobacteria bacterium]